MAGIEHAAISRLKLFHSQNLETMILTVYYNPQIVKNVKNLGLDEKHVLNMYHYFQKAQYVEHFSLDHLRQQGFILKRVADIDDYRIYDSNDRYLMYVNCFLNTEKIHYINFFDIHHKKYKRAIYDVYGFLSKEIYLENQVVIFEIYYDIHGNRVLEFHYAIKNNKNEVTNIALYHDQKTLFFKNEPELARYWLAQIVASETSEVYFFIDRNAYFNPILKDFTAPNLKKISIFHSLHVNSLKNVDTANLSSIYRIPLEHSETYDAIVVSTEQQKIDIQKRFKKINQIHVIQPTYCSNLHYPTKVKKPPNEPVKIISLGRYFYEKRLEHLIEAVHRLRDKNIIVDLYGFPDGRDQQKTFNKLKELVKTYQLENIVTFKGYNNNIKSLLPLYDIASVTSILEGFCIAILDSMNYGIPNIAYDIKYGPAEMIEHQRNGYLIENANIEKFTEHLAQLIDNEELRIEFSKQSFEKSQEFSQDKMRTKWKEFVEVLTTSS